MGNPAIAALIAERLQTGMLHPGDPDRGVKPTPLVLPFKTTGQPKEMADLIDGTVKLLSEAIVHLIETEGGVDLVPQAEAKVMRQAVGDGPTGPQVVPLVCRCDMSKPLAMLTVNDPDVLVTDGRALIRAMHKREIACPHNGIQ